jgi:2-methylaconitate cis-trans-isomerase PrpF
LAAACLLPGSTANKVAVGVKEVGEAFEDIEVSIENPAGKLDATVTAKRLLEQIDISAAAYRRSAQVLMRGVVPLYGASARLVEALLKSLED